MRPGPPPTAPELEFAIDLERLPAIDRDEANAFVAHPAHRVEALGHQELDHVGIGAILRHARHVIEKLVGRVGAEIGGRDLCLGQVGDQRLDVLDTVVDDTDRPRGEAAVAAGLVLRGCLQHQHRGALLLCGKRCTKRRIAGAHNDHIVLFHCSPCLLHSFDVILRCSPSWASLEGWPRGTCGHPSRLAALAPQSEV